MPYTSFIEYNEEQFRDNIVILGFVIYFYSFALKILVGIPCTFAQTQHEHLKRDNV